MNREQIKAEIERLEIKLETLETAYKKEQVTADSNKVTINGGFGKLGSKYSILYAPDLMIQVTITGQLSLLLLIETLELNGFEVVSANTDGVVTNCFRPRRQEFEAIVKEWERVTGFETEETEYSGLYSRDVNNYIAVKPDGKAKRKGVFAPGELRKNPSNEICTNAVVNLLTKNIPIEQTIKECTDIRSFLSIRQVRGGGVRIRYDDRKRLIENEYLGKSIRWYYAKDAGGEIVYAKNGNKVPRSEGAKPLMLLPDSLPDDIDYDWYINEANSILEDIGIKQ